MRLLLIRTVALVTTAAPLYTVSEFGLTGALTAQALAISAAGSVVGEAIAADLTPIAVAGPEALAISATAADINSAGAVAGTTWTDTGPRATVWQNGAGQRLDIWDSYGNVINENGDVAGAGGGSAFLYSAGEITCIEAGTWSAAYDVSNAGQVVGYGFQGSGIFHAFSWTASGGVRFLGTLGGRHSYAQAVTHGGIIVGSSTNGAGYLNAFVYNGEMSNLGTLGGTKSAAYDVNGAGHVVGLSTDAAGRSRAFLWRDGVLFDLNNGIDSDSGWTLEAAYGINSRGQIVRAGTLNGHSTGFILDPAVVQRAGFRAMPVNQNIEAVPEGDTWIMFCSGIVFITASRVINLKRQR